MTGGFWYKYQELIRNITVPYQWKVLNDEIPEIEKSGSVENFRIAAGESNSVYQGFCFQDSDIAKWLECISYLLESKPDIQMEKLADDVIALIGRAQQADGYLNTYFTVVEPLKRFTNLHECDELYCFGHLSEAAVAYAQSTGKKEFLNIMQRYADLICEKFGTGEGQIPACDGHPEAELALVRLFEATGRKEYLDQAAFQLNIRGAVPYYYDIEWERRGRVNFHPHMKDERPSDDKGYDQSECPPRKLRAPVGHAVKMGYLLAGMAAYCQYVDDPEMWDACNRVFEGIRDKQVYVTGSVGTTRHKESFTADYHLPNDRAYAETCASAALVFAMRRMLLNKADSSYADLMERTLYNGLMSGISQDGLHFFYLNPLEVYPPDIEADKDYKYVKPVRQPWYPCACCPPNLARLVADIGEYVYTYKADRVYVHLYAESNARFKLDDGREMELYQRTNYPWDGKVEIVAKCDSSYTLALRKPGWCDQYTITVNKKSIGAGEMLQNGYIVINDLSGETVLELKLIMEPCFIEAAPCVHADAGKLAVMRGPIVYCAEQYDNGEHLFRLAVDPESPMTVINDSCYGAPMIIIKDGIREEEEGYHSLYRRYKPTAKKTEIKMIPYSMWGNRGNPEKPREMAVWIRKIIKLPVEAAE